MRVVEFIIKLTRLLQNSLFQIQALLFLYHVKVRFESVETLFVFHLNMFSMFCVSSWIVRMCCTIHGLYKPAY